MPNHSAGRSVMHRFSYGSAAVTPEGDAQTRSLAIELLCNALPTGALVLDARCRVIFSNRAASDLLLRWNRLHGAHATDTDVPTEITCACDRLRLGRMQASGPQQRPRFGGRVFVQHPKAADLRAVVALERSRRDRRFAVFCVLLHDYLKDNLGGGRKDQLAMLTVAERRVAKLAVEGLRNREIAAALGKSVTTVKTQLVAVFAKLQVGSRVQLAALLRSF